MTDKKKPDWNRLATKEDVVNAMAGFVVAILVIIAIGITQLT